MYIRKRKTIQYQKKRFYAEGKFVRKNQRKQNRNGNFAQKLMKLFIEYV